MPIPATAKKKIPGDMDPELEPPDPVDEPVKKPKAPVSQRKQMFATGNTAQGPPAGAPGGGMGAPPPYRPAPRAGGPPPMMGAAGGMDGGMMGSGMEGGADYGENFGQKLATDIDAVGSAHGMSTQQGRAYAANLFGAVADCLTRAATAGGGGAMEGGAEVEEEPETGTEEETEEAY